jgi:hypothetical protein
MSRRLAGFLVATALQLVVLVLAHDLIYLARYGSRFGEMLVHTGHGDAWAAAATTSLVLGGALAALAAVRLAHLGLLVRRHGAIRHGATHQPVVGGLETRPLLRAWLRIAPRLTVLGVVILSIQENLERASIGATMPGPGILLTPEYAGGLWIAIAVGLAVSLVAALFEWRRTVLLARLRAVRPGTPRPSIVRMRRPGILVELPVSSLLGRRSALRAPPVPTAS